MEYLCRKALNSSSIPWISKRTSSTRPLPKYLRFKYYIACGHHFFLIWKKFHTSNLTFFVYPAQMSIISDRKNSTLLLMIPGDFIWKYAGMQTYLCVCVWRSKLIFQHFEQQLFNKNDGWMGEAMSKTFCSTALKSFISRQLALKKIL